MAGAPVVTRSNWGSLGVPLRTSGSELGNRDAVCAPAPWPPVPRTTASTSRRTGNRRVMGAQCFAAAVPLPYQFGQACRRNPRGTPIVRLPFTNAMSDGLWGGPATDIDAAVVGGPGGVTLVEGSTFCISRAGGDISPGGTQGLYYRDTRFLSRWE